MPNKSGGMVLLAVGANAAVAVAKNYAVFGLALVVDGLSGARAYHQTHQEPRARGRTVAQHIKLSPDPSVKTVVSEDSVAITGNVLGISATAAQHATKQPLWDGVAALMIMGMLIFVALALARRNKNLLHRRGREPEEEQQIAAFLERHDAVKEVSDVLTMRLGTESTLVAARVDFGDDIGAIGRTGRHHAPHDTAQRPRARRLCFLIASTSSDLVIVERPGTSSRRATSSKCFLLALASTPSADGPVLLGPPPSARLSEGPRFSLGSQWSPTFSKLCLTAE
jgi:hypothetical protein